MANFRRCSAVLRDKLKLIFVVHLKHIDSKTPEIESHTINSVDENNEYNIYIYMNIIYGTAG